MKLVFDSSKFLKVFFYACLAYFLLTPIFPQILNINSPLLRKWVMYKDEGYGHFHIDVYNSENGEWINVSALDGYTPSFRSEEKALNFAKNTVLEKYPTANIKLKKSTPNGYKIISLD